MKRQRSSSVKESPKEAPVSINKRHKSANSDECPITVTTRKHLASLPTHGELVVDQGVAQIPSLASKSVSDIRQALASVRKQKKAGGSSDSDSVVVEGKRKILVALQLMKKLNRLSHLHCKEQKDVTQKVKSEVDDLHLQLQNLMYEYNHLQRETANCLEFKSQHEELDLVSVEEFYKQAPSHIVKSEESGKKTEHQEMLLRLEWELEERQRLQAQKESLVKAIDALKEDIQKRQEKLESLQPSLSSLLKASLPVQELLGMPLNRDRDEMRAARLLPVPLYILFVQAKGYSEAIDSSLVVSIVGEVEEAESFVLSQSLAMEEESDGEQETATEGEESERNQRKKESKRAFIKPFPLKIQLLVKAGEVGSLKLLLTYLPKLKLVCAAVEEVNLQGFSDDSMAPSTILHHLVEEDSGSSLPQGTTTYLRRLAKDEGMTLLREYGYAYQWAHRLCGVEHLVTDAEQDLELRPKAVVSQQYLEPVMVAVKQRLAAQAALQKQIKQLGELNLTVGLEDHKLFPPRMYSKLTRWQQLSADSDLKSVLSKFPSAGVLFNTKEESNRFFLAKFQMQQGSPSYNLHVAVCIPLTYPHSPPVLALLVDSNGQKVPVDIHLKQLEQELNLGTKGLSLDDPNYERLLVRLLLKTQMGFDVYHTCSEGLPEGPLPQAMLPFKHKGPLKAFPYRYSAKTGRFHH